jgi:hypothetical protein
MSETPPTISPIGHPRGSKLIRRGKGWGGIAGFAFAALASVLNHAQLFDVLTRGLVGGSVGYVLGWAAAVFAARHIVLADSRAAVEQALERRAQREAAQAAQRDRA